MSQFLLIPTFHCITPFSPPYSFTHLNILCSFDDICTSDPSLCGDAAIDFGFDTVAGVNANLCVEFDNGVHPITCVDFDIPFAQDRTTPMTCQATYDGETCDCSIDESSCVLIDCSMYEPTAVMDTCQKFGLKQSGDVSSLIPRFDIPL